MKLSLGRGSGVIAMIICSCNVLSDHEVRSAIDAPQAPRTAAQIYGCLGCSPECGRCARTIRRIIGEGPKGGTSGSR